MLERHHVGGGDGVGGRGGHLGVAAVLVAVAGQLGVGHFLAMKARRRHLLALREREGRVNRGLNPQQLLSLLGTP